MPLDVDRISVSGVWWRQVRSGLATLARREPPADGRWQRGDRTEALYLADSEETAWAEWYRALAEAALPPRADMPRDLSRLQVDIEDVADLSTVERLKHVGLDLPSPRRADWPSFQAIGDGLRDQGVGGLIAPSAARFGGLILCVFRDRDEIPGVRVTTTTRGISEPPALPKGLRKQ